MCTDNSSIIRGQLVHYTQLSWNTSIIQRTTTRKYLWSPVQACFLSSAWTTPPCIHTLKYRTKHTFYSSVKWPQIKVSSDYRKTTDTVSLLHMLQTPFVQSLLYVCNNFEVFTHFAKLKITLTICFETSYNNNNQQLTSKDDESSNSKPSMKCKIVNGKESR